MKILYIGESKSSTTSSHRALALRRLGHDVRIEDPHETFSWAFKNPLLSLVNYRTGYRFLQPAMLRWTRGIRNVHGQCDLVWINGGELVGIECLRHLKTLNVPIILYNNDDPTGARDGSRFATLRRSLSEYDICAVRLEHQKEEFYQRGARQVFHIRMSYDEEQHKPFDNLADIPAHLRSEVAFVGTWMRHEKRDHFLHELIRKGLPVSIWGPRWQKSPIWNRIKSAYRGGAVSGRDYVGTMQGAKVCIGMLSKGNRDLHTRRSVEIPYSGGLLCAERTPIHAEMYQEGNEALFWSNADECAQACLNLLNSDERRREICANGRRRVLELKVGNEDICQSVMNALQV